MSSPGRPRGFDRTAAVDAAVQLFWALGYEAASLALLREAMGDISAASFYAAYGSKEALFTEVVDRYLASHEGGTAMLASLERPPRETLEQVLRQATGGSAGGQRSRGDLLVLAALLGPDESRPVRDRLAAERSRLRAGILGCVARAIAIGDLPSGTDAVGLAATFETLLFGLSIQARDGVSPETLERAVTNALRLWDGVAIDR